VPVAFKPQRPGVGVEAQNRQWIDSGRALVVPSLRNAARRRRLAAVLSVTRDSGCEKPEVRWPGPASAGVPSRSAETRPEIRRAGKSMKLKRF
jgi:hypothetical protein